MKARRMCSLVLTVLVLLGCSSLPAQAADFPESDRETARIIARASGQFSKTLKAKAYSKATSTFPLAVGEVVKISAVYTPSNASVDFGVTDPKGSFHFVRANNGSVEAEIPALSKGNYTLTLRNNSVFDVVITGIVTY